MEVQQWWWPSQQRWGQSITARIECERPIILLFCIIPKDPCFDSFFFFFFCQTHVSESKINILIISTRGTEIDTKEAEIAQSVWQKVI